MLGWLGQDTLSDGRRDEVLNMEAFAEALVVGPGVWRVMFDFSPDCILMVLADRPYEAGDYIRNIDDFHKHVSHG